MESRDDRLCEEIEALRKTLRMLRGPDGCPWDREQSMDNIITYIVEEAYELLRAERSGDWDEVAAELGDVLFLVIFVHELLLERCPTPLSEIVARVHRKITNRHQHVFGGTKALDTKESVAEWERIKERERGTSGEAGLLADMPDHLPPLRMAAAIQRKAASVGFDWPDVRGILDKLREETVELEQELARGDRAMIMEEIGDLIFTIVNLSRRLGVSPESALETSSAKFVRRFNELEQALREQGETLESASLDEMEALWQRSKGKD